MRTELNRGFTLIEVLVTLVILMFGLLGIAGLMAMGQRASFEAYQRQAALSIANDMAERMRSNRTQAATYAAGATTVTPVGNRVRYDNLLDGSITNCGTLVAPTSCTGAELVAYDIALWDGQLVGYGERQLAGTTLVGGIVGAVGCIEDTTPAPAPACPAAPAPIGTLINRNYRVSVAWQGSEDTVAPTTSTCGAGNFGTATRRRVVSLDTLLFQPCP